MAATLNTSTVPACDSLSIMPYFTAFPPQTRLQATASTVPKVTYYNRRPCYLPSIVPLVLAALYYRATRREHQSGHAHEVPPVVVVGAFPQFPPTLVRGELLKLYLFFEVPAHANIRRPL
ncbi:hypothetical protein VTK73DRAFT_2671 [Phialemonium thermophilum]|uniref:Uncharacterized protein n=1 Tax=Phialemonium thermophilum TaxID=223376 RepID=A0ABR3X3G6_9PEZI